jgi:hypothetical protein
MAFQNQALALPDRQKTRDYCPGAAVTGKLGLWGGPFRSRASAEPSPRLVAEEPELELKLPSAQEAPVEDVRWTLEESCGWALI